MVPTQREELRREASSAGKNPQSRCRPSRRSTTWSAMLLGASSLDGAVEGRGERSMGRDKEERQQTSMRVFFVEMMDLGISFLS